MRRLYRKDRGKRHHRALPARRWAAGLTVVGMAVGAGASTAQSVDIFSGTPAPVVTTAAKPSPIIAPTSVVPIKAPTKPGVKAAPAPAPGTAKTQAQPAPRPTPAPAPKPATERQPSQTERPQPRAPEPTAGPIRREEKPQTDSAPPQAAASPQAAIAPAPAPPVPARAPVVAAPAAPAATAPGGDLLNRLIYPVGIGLGLATELGGLWLLTRWAMRRKTRLRSKTDAAPLDRAMGRQTDRHGPDRQAEPAAYRDEEHDSDPLTRARNLSSALLADRLDRLQDHGVDVQLSGGQAGAPNLHSAPPEPQHPAPEQSVAEKSAPEQSAARRFQPLIETSAPPPPAAPQEAPAPRGVFKPSALFSNAAPIAAAPVAPPDPLAIHFEAVRLSVTLARIELRFRIRLRNDSLIPLGPFRIETCMGTNEGDLDQTWQEYGLDTLTPGQEGTIMGEWRLPLSSVPTLRVGAVRLLVGAARIIATVANNPLYRSVERDFLIGLPEEGGRLVPVTLDASVRIHDNLITQAITPA